MVDKNIGRHVITFILLMKLFENIDKRENLHNTIQKSTKNEDFAPFSNKKKCISSSPIAKREKEGSFEIGEKEIHNNNSIFIYKFLFLIFSKFSQIFLLFKRC